MFTCLTFTVALLDIEVYAATGTVCADTGASQSVGGELMFKFLRNRRQKFSEFHLAMCLADGQQSTSLVQKATVPITVGGRTIQIDLTFLPHAKGNGTLLDVDFLRTSGIVLDMCNNFWYFGDKPSFKIPFSKHVPLPVDDNPVEINSSSCPTNSIPSEVPLHSNTVDETETNDLHLRQEGQDLNVEERNDLMVLLNKSKNVFRLGGEPTPFVKHFINTGDHPPVSSEPYRLSPNRKEIDNLLADNIIEECESSYAAPVVLVSKSNGTVRLCIDYRKCNFIADMFSRPESKDEEICELKTIIIHFPTRTANELRTEQLKDLELKKIIDCFENPNKGVDFANWTGRGYVMNQGVLYRYSPHAEVEEAELVVPTHEREKILKLHHDAPTAAHYGADGTFSRISSKYYWTAQRFESIAVDLFGPLPETTEGMKWIFIVEDYTTKWVELFPLKQATAKECAMTLLNEVFLRYGVPRRLISDNGTQFVSAVMQQLCFVLDINQSLIPVYHPRANPVERIYRDLKPRLAMMVGNNHTLRIEKLPSGVTYTPALRGAQS
ncbi:retrovirus-related Pol polyprotein from transposon 412 [Trichonephila clavipes]|nr:retrovirus-related Pol polyprotein from transposon 412 [Trichonephila clavipes]